MREARVAGNFFLRIDPMDGAGWRDSLVSTRP
jgi:hypothetical protein